MFKPQIMFPCTIGVSFLQNKQEASKHHSPSPELTLPCVEIKDQYNHFLKREPKFPAGSKIKYITLTGLQTLSNVPIALDRKKHLNLTYLKTSCNYITVLKILRSTQ
jgi:hypothetical protein